MGGHISCLSCIHWPVCRMRHDRRLAGEDIDWGERWERVAADCNEYKQLAAGCDFYEKKGER